MKNRQSKEVRSSSHHFQKQMMKYNENNHTAPPDKQKDEGKHQATAVHFSDPTAVKAPPYRWAALLMAGLCIPSVSAIIFLSVYMHVCKPPWPKNWELFNGKCYFISTESMNWISSRDNCKSMGADLVIIESQTEQMFLLKKVMATGNDY
ncbi:killer cell lectin-like receptor subfamily E member 1 [Acipenser ruthenus]|uniref:killer cell lectin-like receptor subfamily E member 1 n=1 Tax=Acipenser ruthenus TaxID=7906 RepID=UPI0027419207|nr:killer cell lectin-like receptor subfamily E member 1 [Acipenser ruthenus]